MKAATAHKDISDAARIQARALYVTSNCSLTEIAVSLGLSGVAFRHARKAWGWPMRPPKPLRRLGFGNVARLNGAGGVTLALSDQIEAQLRRELEAVDAMLVQDPAAVLPATAASIRARTIASLVRALVELRRLDVSNPAEEAADNGFPASLEDLRAELARRIDRLRAARESGSADEGIEPGSA